MTFTHRLNVFRCKNCDAQMGRRNFNKESKLCRECYFNPKEEDCCIEITTKGTKCKRRKKENEEYCTYHYKLRRKKYA